MKTKPESIEKLRFEESENIPNNPSLPVLLYRAALDPEDGSLAGTFESRYRENQWRGAWRWGVYDFHHYHSNAHEVLGVASGEAELKLGGPRGKTVTVRAGDVVILSAGTGHMDVGSSNDFQVVGAYPAGQEDKDLIRNDEPLDDAIRERIMNLPLPKVDPVFGEDGPLLHEWH